jgi:large exoprotein involved in heme utilization and adhesion
MKSTFARLMVLVAVLPAIVQLQGQTTGSPMEKDFVSGGKVEMTLESGGYDIRPSSDNRIHVRWNEASGKGVAVKLAITGKSADLRVENTPKNFHASIEVPAATHLRIRLTAGALNVGTIQGDKDIEINAGDVKVTVGNPNDWGDVDASVIAGDLHASAFEAQKGGLFRSFQWKGPGRYRLHVHAMAGSISLNK